jgi:hypothetical protein
MELQYHGRGGLLMPRILSAETILEKNRTDSDHPFCLLFELNIENGPGAFRFVAYDQDVTFHGLFFSRFVADIDSLEEVTGGALVHLKINAQNVDQSIISLLENYWVTVPDPMWVTTVWQIDAKNPDATAYESGEIYSILSVSTDFVSANFDLVAEGVSLGTTLPKRRFTSLGGFPDLPRAV